MSCRFMGAGSYGWAGAGSPCWTLKSLMETVSRPEAAITCVTVTETPVSEKRVTGSDSRIPPTNGSRDIREVW